MSWRYVLALIGVVAPVGLLSAQAYWSAHRDLEAQQALERERNQQRLEVAADAVEARLESLRREEEAREFYLYNHFYSPPNVLAVADPIAVSPLAKAPEDELLVGYFQFFPDGSTVTPHAREHAATPTSERVLDALGNPAFNELRGLASDGKDESVVLATRVREPDAPPIHRPRQRRKVRSQGAHNGNGSARRKAPPVTVALNRNAEELFDDIQLSNQGSLSAQARVQSRARQTLPQRQDNLVLVDEGAIESLRSGRGNTASGSSAQRDSPPPQQTQRSQRLRRRIRRRSKPPPTVKPTLAAVRQKEGEVAYSQMVFRPIDERTIVLYRAVAHQDAVVVQGVLLDGEHLTSQWLEETLQNAAGDEAVVRIEPPGKSLSCSARASLPPIFGGTQLCYPTAATQAQAALLASTMRYELVALAAFAFTALLSLFGLGWMRRKEAQLVRRKTDFITAVSHELRTPLTTVRMHAEMLQESLVPKDQQEKVYRELVQQSVRLSALVDNVLELARLDDGKRTLHPTPGDLAAEVGRIVEGQRGHVEAAGVTLRGPSDEEPIPARFDILAMEQIVVNLIDNALKYGVTDDAREIRVRVAEHDRGASVSVEDAGLGIPEAQLQTVFDRFHRVDREELAHVPGTGIGLALVKELVEAQGGTVSLKNLHPGIRVTVQLPVN